jgi:acetyl-CoA synthetase
LYILYTSGTTGKPKGVLHSTGGYLTYAYATAKWVFDFRKEDIFFCTADIGWVTGHSYIVYAPLMHGVTEIMYEGTADYLLECIGNLEILSLIRLIYLLFVYWGQ